ncbi:hypothetical protein [Beijerinckia indica]|uniref:Uncharacterized protein n=1 Tax=Beijerinckia indica subsp. indica (strain ATCC 9039 / DSM 1715 / NCIMB 8712) TaxID=395963 RepID=B2IEB4_BEII9|nr:hypothetical protein [Beijerinckia indica]ACB95512.1 hypothetical protein Bind_1888 [Beijerinckia indica subsp. indica ATCC 9039]
MTEHAQIFFWVTLLALITVWSIFGMKYFSAARQARLRFAADSDYRKLAEKIADAQTSSVNALAALQTDFAELKTG